jgi:twitching motility protein PilT
MVEFWNRLLQEARTVQASDLHLTIGAPPLVRLQGLLSPLAKQAALTAEMTASLLRSFINEEQWQQFCQLGELDLIYEVEKKRYRIHAFQQHEGTAVAVRLIPEILPTLAQLGHPEVLRQLACKRRGLVIICGPTGCGKSTTLAAMVHQINCERCCHVITLEEPIEYLHTHRRSIVNQREIPQDTPSFSQGLRAALREDPDVILVGEMRDAETMQTVLTAAETGHLVLATLHTNEAAQALDRIIDGFPPYQQQQVRQQLSMVLEAVVAQQLLPLSEGPGRVAALEILLATPAVRALIREGKTHQLLSIMQTNGKMGMQTMDMAVAILWRRGLISRETACTGAKDLDLL